MSLSFKKARHMNRTFKRWAGGTMLLAGCCALSVTVLCANPRIAQDETKPVSPAIKVAVATVAQDEKSDVLTGIGELEATRQVKINAEVNGRVTAIFFRAGEVVQAGQTLVQLNDAPERGELARLKAQSVNAKLRLQRTKHLVPQQAATQEQLDQAQADYQVIQGDIARVTALIEQKRVKAPFSGVLGVRTVNLGEFVKSGAALVSLTDVNTLFANVTLPERDFAKLKPGQAIQIAVDAYPSRTFTGKVSTVEPRIDPGTRTLLVQAMIPNTEKLLTPGMYVKASIVMPTRERVLSVPETAVSYNTYGDFVYAVQGSDEKKLSARLIQVKTGNRSHGRAVLLEGVKAGDRVVTSGQLRLSNGAHVEIISQDSVSLETAPKSDLDK